MRKVVVLIFVLFTSGMRAGTGKEKSPLYLDPKAKIEERVDDLLSRMTIKRKSCCKCASMSVFSI